MKSHKQCLTTEEVAQRLGLTMSAVKGRTVHARWFLRKHRERIKPSHVAVRSYCFYVQEQTKAEAIRLRTASSEFGFTQQPIAGGIPQKFTGATHSAPDAVKSVMVGREARADCSLYRSTLAVTQRIFYALPSLENEALENRLRLVANATVEHEKTTAENRARFASGNATIQSEYLLDSAKAKLETDRSTTALSLSIIYVPPLAEGRLVDLAEKKQTDEAKKQRAIDKVNRQQNWNIAISLGARKDTFPLFGGSRSGAYGNFLVTYNFGSKASNAHLDAAEKAWWDYKENQANDTNLELAVLKSQIVANIVAREEEIVRLEAQQKILDGHLFAVASPILRPLPRLETNSLSTGWR